MRAAVLCEVKTLACHLNSERGEREDGSYTSIRAHRKFTGEHSHTLARALALDLSTHTSIAYSRPLCRKTAMPSRLICVKEVWMDE